MSMMQGQNAANDPHGCNQDILDLLWLVIPSKWGQLFDGNGVGANSNEQLTDENEEVTPQPAERRRRN